MPMQNKHDSLDLTSMFSIASALFASHSVPFFKDVDKVRGTLVLSGFTRRTQRSDAINLQVPLTFAM